MKQKVASVLKLMKGNRVLSKAVIQKTKEKVVKENLILSLRADMTYYQADECRNNQTLSDVAIRRMQLEDDGKLLQVYCKKMKDVLNEFIDRVEYYESEIEKCKKENRMIIMSNEAIITQKHNEKSELMKQHDILNSKLQSQIIQINNINIQIKELEERKQLECKGYEEKEAVENKRYDVFHMKYRELLGKFDIYEHEIEADDIVKQMVNRKTSGNLIGFSVEELKMRLNEMKIRNQILQKDYDDCKIKVFEYNQMNQHPKDSKRNRMYEYHSTTMATNSSNNNYSNQMTYYK